MLPRVDGVEASVPLSKRHHSRRGPKKAQPPTPAVPTAYSKSGRTAQWLLVGAAISLAIIAVAVYFSVRGRTGLTYPTGAAPSGADVAALPAANYVGGKMCAACHAKEQAAWTGSHHQLAMQVASDNTVLGNFGGAKYSYAGVTSTFFKRDGKFFVNTDGPDGKLGEFEVKFTFGVTPLQQYLIELPGGRLQAFGIAWDSRPQPAGGQRWFHLYPGRKLAAGDPQHWTGIDQNWNYQCADCHSTNLRKHYDAEARRFDTTWSEINVSCEGCHGPGSVHVAWAKKEGDWQRFGGPGKGLVVALEERRAAFRLLASYPEAARAPYVAKGELSRDPMIRDICRGLAARPPAATALGARRTADRSQES